MKKLLIALTLTAGLISTTANAGVSKSNQAYISEVLNGAQLNNVWAQDISLWIQNPGWPKHQLEMIGNQICDSTRGSGFYVITWWDSIIGPRGSRAKIKCN